jgi:hypothetical protein
MATSDAAQIVRSYRGCQYFTRQIHVTTQELQTIPFTWLFTVWGLDLLGPFKKVPEALTHMLSHLVSRPKPNAHSMCAQESSLHTYRIENKYKITNVII